MRCSRKDKRATKPTSSSAWTRRKFKYGGENVYLKIKFQRAKTSVYGISELPDLWISDVFRDTHASAANQTLKNVEYVSISQGQAKLNEGWDMEESTEQARLPHRKKKYYV
jgi:hypothetical protein